MDISILGITANPSIDKTAIVPGFRPDSIHRPERVLALAGGKGLNAARTIKTLGGDVRTCLILAGHSGEWIAGQLERENIPAAITWAAGETRECLSILDPLTKTMTEIYEDGLPITPAVWDEFVKSIATEIAHAQWMTISGSLPVGAPQRGYTDLIQIAHTNATRVILDTHGEPLREALSANPAIVKVNATEASELTGQAICTEHEALRAANTLRRWGIQSVVVTLGKQGAVAIDDNGAWFARAPHVDAVSAVGSGDAFLGGMAVSLARGESFRQALALAAAAGAANTLEIGAGIFNSQIAHNLAAAIEITQIA